MTVVLRCLVAAVVSLLAMALLLFVGSLLPIVYPVVLFPGMVFVSIIAELFPRSINDRGAALAVGIMFDWVLLWATILCWLTMRAVSAERRRSEQQAE